jgi:Rrf2 family nitric oxide-sensitive transcriptional repressor
MRLNLQSDYALRLLTRLAASEGELITIKQVADQFRISQGHLMKVAHALGRAQFIETVRGRSGGLRLARPANAISIGEVVRSMEGDFALVECFLSEGGACLITGACKLKRILRQALDAFLEVLDEYTIADLTKSNPRLIALLNNEAA